MASNLTAKLGFGSDFPLTNGAIVSSLAPIDRALYKTKTTKANVGSKAHPYIEKAETLKD